MTKKFTSNDRLVPFIIGEGAFYINIPIIKPDEYYKYLTIIKTSD